MKEYILGNIYVESPLVTSSLQDNAELAYLELAELFREDDEESVFDGFDTSLNTLFNSNDDSVIFEGFETSLNTIFRNDSENEDFLGFC